MIRSRREHQKGFKVQGGLFGARRSILSRPPSTDSFRRWVVQNPRYRGSKDDGKGKSRLDVRDSRVESQEAVFCALGATPRPLREAIHCQLAPDARSWRDERALLDSALREPRTRRRRDGRFLRVELRRRHRRDGLEETRKRMYVLQLSSKNSSITTSARAALPPAPPVRGKTLVVRDDDDG